MVVVLGRKHAILFTVIFSSQVFTLWRISIFSACLQSVPLFGWYLIAIAAASTALVNSVIVLELVEILLGARRDNPRK